MRAKPNGFTPAIHLVLLLLLATTGLAAPAGAAGRQEAWFFMVTEKMTMGFGHSVDEETTFQGRPAGRSTVDTTMAFKRQGTVLRLPAHSEEIYDADLKPLWMQSVDSSEGIPHTFEARWDGQAWQITSTKAGRVTAHRWQPPRPGYFMGNINTLVMRQHPTGNAEYHFPIVDVTRERVEDTAVRVTLPAEPLPGGEHPYARLEFKMMDQPIVVWVDNQGNVLRQLAWGIEFQLCTQAQAEGFTPVDLDPLDQMQVKLDRPLPEGSEIKSLRLRIRFGEERLAAAMPETETQHIVSRNRGEVVVELRSAAAVAEGAAPVAVTPSLKPFLAADEHIQADDAQIVAQARAAVYGETSANVMVQNLMEWIQRHLHYSLDVLAPSALSAYVSRKGDCKSYAALLTAMARAVGLPAREASGLLYNPAEQAFRGHAWTEIYLGRWIGFNPTNHEPVDATFIQMDDALFATKLSDVHIEVVAIQGPPQPAVNALMAALKTLVGDGNRYGPVVTQVVLQSLFMAQGRGSRWIHPQDLLVGLWADQGFAGRVLRSMGVNPQKLKPSPPPADRRGDAAVPLQLDPESSRILDRSRQLAGQYGAPFPAGEHLLLSLLEDKGGTVAKLLQQNGFDPAAVRARLLQVMELLKLPPVPASEQRDEDDDDE